MGKRKALTVRNAGNIAVDRQVAPSEANQLPEV